jgi:hypothetical protein
MGSSMPNGMEEAGYSGEEKNVNFCTLIIQSVISSMTKDFVAHLIEGI